MPRNKLPIVCLPDTNSLIHLRGVIVANRSACLWLWDEFEVQISDEIPQELQNNAARNPDLEVREIARKVPASVVALKADLQLTERCFLHPIGVEFDDDYDLGERKNTQLAFQSIAQNQARQTIFLTDERKALEPETGFVYRVFNNYPLGIIWNSMDFLLYLYFRHKRIQFQEAEDALREVNGRMLGKPEVMAQRLTTYNKRLDLIAGARRRVPGLWL
jgi:hypothetical protein